MAKLQNPYLKYSALGFQMAATIGICIWIGMQLDQWLEMSIPIFVLIFALIGVIGTMISLIKELSYISKEQNKENHQTNHKH